MTKVSQLLTKSSFLPPPGGYVFGSEEKSEELEPVLDQEELDRVSEETEAVISRKDPLLSSEEEQLLLPGGAGSVIFNRDVQVQVEPGLISNTDVTVQTDGDTEIEDLKRKNVTMAKELANKQAVIAAHENQLVDYYQSIQELKAELKMAQEKNDVQNQMESALVREKEALKQELQDKVTLDEENTMKIVQLNEELEKAKKEIDAHDELKSILLAENEVLKKSNKERSFLNKELALEKINLEKELMEARANDQKRSQGHQRLVEELQGEISKALVQNHEIKEAVFTVTKKNEGLREQLENKAKDVICSLKKELQKRDLENVIKDDGMGNVERCETATEDDKRVVVVKEEKQEGEGPTRKLLLSASKGRNIYLEVPSSEDGFQDQQPRLMELEGLRLILGGGLLMRKFWAEEEKSEELDAVLDQEELDGVSEETEAVISRKDPLLSGEEEQLLLPGGAGRVISNRDVQIQVEPGPISNTDVTVQTDGGHRD
ncbi:M protein, serotype 5-like [Palaemon carinicauda]|uniref:M protein, serotype 5-like n=1 Tax=Palaemon carinicauda TaxID=392227 RepID=UPI0035B695A4